MYHQAGSADKGSCVLQPSTSVRPSTYPFRQHGPGLVYKE